MYQRYSFDRLLAHELCFPICIQIQAVLSPPGSLRSLIREMQEIEESNKQEETEKIKIEPKIIYDKYTNKVKHFHALNSISLFIKAYDNGIGLSTGFEKKSKISPPAQGTGRAASC